MPHVVQRAVLPTAVCALLLLGPPAAAGAGEGAGAEGRPGWSRLLRGDVSLAEVQDVRITVGCLTDDGWRTLEIYGDGVGFWQERTQIRVRRDRIESVLDAFRRADFAEMDEVHGRTPESPKTPPVPEAEGQPARLICRVRLGAGGAAKEVRQFDKGPVSEALRELAYEVLDVGRAAAAEGVTVEDLPGGLRKLRSGDLDPRALAVQVQRRFGQGAGREREGWILRLHGRRAELQRFTAGGLTPPETLGLEAERLRAVVGSLAEHDVATLPQNLWAEHYTDLRVSVLGHSHAVQARRFAGLDPTTHGERQEDFEAIFAELESLAAAVGPPEDAGSGAGGAR